MARIVVVGAGFSGLTTAAAFALLGHHVKIVAERRVDRAGPADPRIPSFYPAASVIPVSVGGKHMAETVGASRAMFGACEHVWPWTVRRQRHYEVGEGLDEVPAEFLMAADEVQEVTMDACRGLQRRDAGNLRVWRGRICFVEVPEYLAELSKLLDALGVEFEERRLASGELPSDGDVVVVCAGFGSPDLLDDPQPSQLLRGHLIHLDPQTPLWPDGEWASYHYLPGARVFAQPDGRAGELYFYPRHDRWILGGTRQAGRMVGAEFEVDGDEGALIEIGGVPIPAPVVEVHRELLAGWLGINLDAVNPRVVTGYRYARDPAGTGLRLEVVAGPLATTGGRLVLANYGHGGAGVTLSWGCAARSVALALDAGIEAPEGTVAGVDPGTIPLVLGLAREVEAFRRQDRRTP